MHFAFMQTSLTFIGKGEFPFIQTLLNNGAFWWLAQHYDFPFVPSLLANATVISRERIFVLWIVQTFC